MTAVAEALAAHEARCRAERLPGTLLRGPQTAVAAATWSAWADPGLAAIAAVAAT